MFTVICRALDILYTSIDPDKLTTNQSIYADPRYFPIVPRFISTESY